MARWWPYLGLAGLLLALFALGTSLLARPRFGVLDVARIVKESPRALRYERELDAKYAELNRELARKKMSAAERQKAEEAAYAEYLKKKQALEARLEREVAAATAAEARQRRLSLVLYKEAVRFGGVDITSAVIGRLK